MPVYSFYPQARGSTGEKIDALLATPDEARERADQILAAHPEAFEVSIWCDEVYVGRVGNVPWTPPARTAAELSSAIGMPAPRRKPRSGKARPPKASPKAPSDAPLG